MHVLITVLGRGPEQSRGLQNHLKQNLEWLWWCHIVKPENSSFDPGGDSESLQRIEQGNDGNFVQPPSTF